MAFSPDEARLSRMATRALPTGLSLLLGISLILSAPAQPVGLAADSPRASLPVFVVQRFQFESNTVFSSTQLETVVGTYTNRPITALDLEAARVAVTQFYITNGYLNSGALMDQLPTNGLATLRIVEGRLTDIRLHGNRWVRTQFYSRRLAVSCGEPLNVNRIYNTLQVWRAAYPIQQVNAELLPGADPGTATLDVRVTEKNPFHFGLQYANDKPPSTGPEQITALARDDSLTGHGDPLSVSYGVLRSQGDGLADADFLGADDIAAAYAVPVTPYDTTVGAQYSRSSAAIVEAPFDHLDITSESVAYGLNVSQPFYRTATREFSLTLIGERKSNRTTLLGVPYSLSAGAIDGESAVSALRLFAQFIDRGADHVFSARFGVSEGLYALGATENASGPDGQFVSLLGQAQYLHRLWNTRNEIMFRVAGQYTPDQLLTLEQLALGGSSTVPGYRENTLVRDFGGTGTMEFHVPLWISADDRSRLQLVPFTSIGAGWNHGGDTPAPDNISSAGIGITLNWRSRIEASLLWGHAFQDIRETSHDLQDDGIHFKVTAWAL